MKRKRLLVLVSVIVAAVVLVLLARAITADRPVSSDSHAYNGKNRTQDHSVTQPNEMKMSAPGVNVGLNAVP